VLINVRLWKSGEGAQAPHTPAQVGFKEDDMIDKRVSFDFEVDFSNGGGIQGQSFRLDIEGNDIADDALAAYIIRDLRLLMVGAIRIHNKRIVEERHKRAAAKEHAESISTGVEFIDLSHKIESGLINHKGLCGRIEMVASVGTCLITPYHRYADGYDLTGLLLEWVSNLPGLVVRVSGSEHRAIDWQNFAASSVRGRAVLVNTGWDTHWRTERYFEGHPFLTQKAAEYLRDEGVALVGIDSLDIDEISGGSRPVHSVLLAAGIPIIEHLTNVSAVPAEGFYFSAVPPKIAAMGTFPVRAHAQLVNARRVRTSETTT
jgi:kynurenine formamidase